ARLAVSHRPGRRHRARAAFPPRGQPRPLRSDQNPPPAARRTPAPGTLGTPLEAVRLASGRYAWRWSPPGGGDVVVWQAAPGRVGVAGATGLDDAELAHLVDAAVPARPVPHAAKREAAVGTAGEIHHLPGGVEGRPAPS